jgi:glycosyltransferase involved in cell wall biosynthesis
MYLQYTNPGAYPPLLHSAELLVRAGCGVRFLGMGSAEDPRRVLTSGAGVRLFGRSAAAALRPAHYAAFTAWAAWHALLWRPAWIYASDPLSCPAVRVVRWCCGARIVYHEHDSPGPRDEARRSAFWTRVMRARLRVSRRADVCVLPADERAEAFRERTGRRDVLVVWNCPLLREIAAAPTARPGLRVLYHGSIVPARVPVALVEALTRLPEDVTLTLIGYETAGHPGYVAQLVDRARALGVAHRLTCRGPVSRDALLRDAPSFDVGVSLLPTVTHELNERSMVGASNKPFDYMAGGLALLVPDRPEWQSAFVQPGFGVGCRAEQADDIASALRWLLDHPDERLAMGRRAQARIRERWNYDLGFAPVLDRIAGVRRPTAAMAEAGRA